MFSYGPFFFILAWSWLCVLFRQMVYLGWAFRDESDGIMTEFNAYGHLYFRCAAWLFHRAGSNLLNLSYGRSGRETNQWWKLNRWSNLLQERHFKSINYRLQCVWCIVLSVWTQRIITSSGQIFNGVLIFRLTNGDGSGFYGFAVRYLFRQQLHEKFAIGLRENIFSVFNGGWKVF